MILLRSIVGRRGKECDCSFDSGRRDSPCCDFVHTHRYRIAHTSGAHTHTHTHYQSLSLCLEHYFSSLLSYPSSLSLSLSSLPSLLGPQSCVLSPFVRSCLDLIYSPCLLGVVAESALGLSPLFGVLKLPVVGKVWKARWCVRSRLARTDKHENSNGDSSC